MAVRVSWDQALAWRLERQMLDPAPALSADEVVRRLGGVQAQVASSAELAIRVRQASSASGDVAAALLDGRLIKTWAMRGTLHLLVPDEAGWFLSLLASGRTWELPSWQRYFGMTPRHWALLRPAVREALDGAALTREELITAVTTVAGLEHIGDALRSGWGTLLKPLAWQGDLVYGPSQGSRVTFTRPEAASAAWTGVPEPDVAAPKAIARYLGAYGPATAEGFGNWLSRGRIAKRRMRAWFAELGDRVVEIDIDGELSYVLAEDLAELAATKPGSSVRLVPGFDPWVLGPGTDDPRVVAPARRPVVSRQAGWIAPVVIRGGRVCGTWELRDDRLGVDWFAEAGAPPDRPLAAEVERLSTIVGRPLQAEVRLA